MSSKATPSSLRETIKLLTMRAGLGMVLLLFGVEKLTSPSDWIIYLPLSLGPHLSRLGLTASEAFFGLGFFELIIGLHLIAGLYVRTLAWIASAELVLIVAAVGLDHTGVRDLGLLLGVALPLVLRDGVKITS